MLWFEMGNCCLNIPHLNAIDYKSHEHEAESKNANKTWPAGMLLWHNANTAEATWRWGTLIYRTLFINLCHTKLTAEQYPFQNLLMIKQTRMISKTEKKSLDFCFIFCHGMIQPLQLMLKNLKTFGMQTIHFLAFTKLIS